MDGLFFLILVFAMVAWRVAMHFVDIERIRRQAVANGWLEVEVSWQPFAPGWLGERSRRQYQVFYKDADGNQCESYAATSMLADVYWRHSDF